MIRVENIGILRDEWIFRNVSFDLPEGKLFGIIGGSGAGKTSLLKAISGHLDIAEGKVTLNGKKITGPTAKLVAGYEEIQLVNQDFELDTFHTVAENIKEKVLHLPKENQQEIVEELLDLMELNDLRDRQVRWVSGGEQQRVSIARALAVEPKYLLLDEPFVHLDQRIRFKIMGYLRSLNQMRNTTIVLVSHDGAEMMGFVDEVMHLSNGSIQRIASADDMFFHPESEEQAELMGLCNVLEVDGEKCIFRPSEYRLDEPDIDVKFLTHFDTGFIVFNYFLTKSNARIVLSSTEPMRDVEGIRIHKRA